MEDNYVEFEIFFSDLNEDAQQRLMEAVGITHPREMNWDFDWCPLSIFEVRKPEA